MAGDLIDSTEMYLRTVLELEEEGIPALRARLAERLGISAPSISEGVTRLEAQGLLHLADDRTVELTDQGRDWALRVMRKHRIAERLLADVVGLDPAFIHEEACRWEHVISDRVEARLTELLGGPTTSPYGNPIPGSNDDYGRPVTSVLDAGRDRVRLHSISEALQSDPEVIAAMYAAGVTAGSQVTVDIGPGEVRLAGADGSVGLSLEQARLVYIAPQ